MALTLEMNQFIDKIRSIYIIEIKTVNLKMLVQRCRS